MIGLGAIPDATVVMTLAPAKRLNPPHEVPQLNADGRNTLAWQQHDQDVADRLATLTANMGITDGSDTVPGQVGEVISSVVLGSSPISIAGSTNTDITSIILSPGDWDAAGTMYFEGSSKGGSAELRAWVNDVPVTQPMDGHGGIAISSTSSANLINQLSIPVRRYNITMNTTVHLGAYAAISSGTMLVAGFIRARRMR